MVQARLKVLPEDFVVEEEISLPVRKTRGPFRVYRLEKEHWNTLDALRDAAAVRSVPMREIRYGGKKDRHAHTVQYVTVPARFDLETRWKNVAFTFVGYADEQMSPHFLRGNNFRLILRGLAPADEAHMLARLIEIRTFGYANYFDDQRFGSVGADGAFLAERLVKGELNGALRLYFTSVHPESPRDARERKMRIDAAWGDWELVRDLSDSPIRREMAELLTAGGKDRFLQALRRMPAEELSMYFSAWQSCLWNECLARILRAHMRELFPVEGYTGTFLHYRDPGASGPFLRELHIPTIASRFAPCDEEVRTIVEEVLAERGVRRAQCNLREIRQSYLSSFSRDGAVFPGDLSWTSLEEDERYPGRLKTTLRFFLPRGSYATMLFKALLL